MEAFEHELEVPAEPLHSMPTECDELPPLDSLDHDQYSPLLPDLQPDGRAQTSFVFDPFRPVMEELIRLNQVNPQLANQVSDIIRLYSRLWGAYVAKEAVNQSLQMANKELRAANANLCQQQVFMERRHANQEALLAYFEHAFDRVREGIVGMLQDCDDRAWNPSHETGGQGDKEVA
ncbi:hypothetical protein N7523_010264 [Penicillium sp. IBT 18751x]|nr:hypothetical protein N7523_010264 [Penicillium sp. IBT 18751x]